MLLACLLYHTRSTEHVARTDTLHLDTYSMSAGKISGTHGGEKGAGTPRSAGIALTVNPVSTEELVHLLEEVGYVQPSAFEAAVVQSGRSPRGL